MTRNNVSEQVREVVQPPGGGASAGCGSNHIALGSERRLAVEHWLLVAAPDISQARWEWGRGDLTFLRCGAMFTALRIPGDTARAAAGTDDPGEVDAYLAGVLEGGPVIAAHGLTRYWALVPPSKVRNRWRPVAECVVPRTMLGVPPVDRTTYEGGASYWSVPIDTPGELCHVGLVDRLVERGRRRLDESDR